MAKTRSTASSNKVKLTYVESANYQIAPITGVQGGMTPTGQLKIDFFNEYFRAASEEVREVSKDGKSLTDLKENDLDPQYVEIVRCKHFGMVIALADAESVANWLLTKVEETRAAQGENAPE